jgi:hypothetical protein
MKPATNSNDKPNRATIRLNMMPPM